MAYINGKEDFMITVASTEGGKTYNGEVVMNCGDILGQNLKGKTVKLTFAVLESVSIEDTQLFFIDDDNKVEVNEIYDNYYYYDDVHFGGNSYSVDSTMLDSIIYTFPDGADAIVIKYNAELVTVEVVEIVSADDIKLSLENGQSATLKCKGMKMSSDVLVEVAEAEQGGGAELNIAYGETEPTDTSKLWVKADEPSKVSVGVMEEPTDTEISTVAKLTNGANSIATVAVGTNVYLFGGYYWSGSKNVYLNTINFLDTKTNTKAILSVYLPKGASEIGVASVGTKIYLFGGYNGDGVYLNTICVFDTETNTISTLSTKLPSALGSIATASVGTKIYLFGGCYFKDGTVRVDTIYVFDTETDTITTLTTRLNVSASHITAVSVGTKIYLFGGTGKPNTIRVFDTETNTITTLSTILPTGITSVGVTLIDSKIYLCGGDSDNGYLNTIIVFDTKTNTIETLSTTLPTPTTKIGVASVGNKIYLCGGSDSSSVYLNTINELNIGSSVPLDNGTMQIATNGDNLWQMLNTDTVTAEIGVKDVYIGNADGVAEKVPSALFKDGAWVEI